MLSLQVLGRLRPVSCEDFGVLEVLPCCSKDLQVTCSPAHDGEMKVHMPIRVHARPFMAGLASNQVDASP